MAQNLIASKEASLNRGARLHELREAFEERRPN